MSDLLDFNVPALGDLLPPHLRDALEAIAVPRRYKDGALIHSRGDVKPGLSIVASGSVHIGNTGSDGSYVTTTILGPGQTFGEFTLFADLPRTHDAVAVGPTVINQIGRAPFMRLYDQDPELGKIVLIATTKRLHVVLEFLDDLRRLPLTVCAAKLLLMMSYSAETPNKIIGNQVELAFTLGVSRVSIGKALKMLEAEGVIKLGYGYIEVSNEALLAEWITDRSALAPITPG